MRWASAGAICQTWSLWGNGHGYYHCNGYVFSVNAIDAAPAIAAATAAATANRHCQPPLLLLPLPLPPQLPTPLPTLAAAPAAACFRCPLIRPPAPRVPDDAHRSSATPLPHI